MQLYWSNYTQALYAIEEMQNNHKWKYEYVFMQLERSKAVKSSLLYTKNREKNNNYSIKAGMLHQMLILNCFQL